MTQVAAAVQTAARGAEIESQLRAQAKAAAQTTGLHGSGTEHDDSAVNGVSYSCRNDSVVTPPPHAPGNAATPDPHTPANQGTTNPPDRAINAPAPNTEIDQDEVDHKLGSYTQNEDGLPAYDSPEDQESLNLVETEARNFKCIGYFYRGDPMEDLDYPDFPPPEEVSHFLGRYVDMWSRTGDFLGPAWVSYRRMLMWELLDNCVRRASHWLGARYPERSTRPRTS